MISMVVGLRVRTQSVNFFEINGNVDWSEEGTINIEALLPPEQRRSTLRLLLLAAAAVSVSSFAAGSVFAILLHLSNLYAYLYAHVMDHASTPPAIAYRVGFYFAISYLLTGFIQIACIQDLSAKDGQVIVVATLGLLTLVSAFVQAHTLWRTNLQRLAWGISVPVVAVALKTSYLIMTYYIPNPYVIP